MCVFLLGCGKKELSQEKVSEDIAVDKKEELVIQPEEETQQTETTVSEQEEPIQTETEHKEEEKKPETPSTPKEPAEQSTPEVAPEISKVEYSPQEVVRLATEKTKAHGKILLTENLDRLLSEGKISKEEYDAYYPYDGAGYYSVFVETDLNEARTTSGTLLHSVDGIATYVAEMLALEPGPYFLIEYVGVYQLNGTDFYEFRCYRA